MNLKQMKELAQAINAPQANHSILIYGPPKAGKTELVGTAAKIPEVERIFWFDTENGSETISNMGLTSEEEEKITLWKLPNTRDNPVAIETMLKVFSAKSPVPICHTHGILDCSPCTKTRAPITSFSLGMCSHYDLVVIDSGSELADSALSATMKGKDVMFKPGWDEYGLQGKWLGDILSVVQQAYHTNFVVCTHELVTEDLDGKDKFFPLMGSKPFSMKVAKYFGTVVYVHKKLNKHVAASSSTYRGDILTGSRINAMMEKAIKPDMRQILIEGGILKPKSIDTQVASTEVKEIVKPVEAKVAVVGGLAARLAARNK